VTRVEPASLVLTVLNEAQGLPVFLGSLSAQSVIPAEIVIVDGGSTDGTVALLEGWPAPAGCEVTVLSKPGAGISEGRNEAIAASTHERILVTDGGTALSPRWVESMLDAFEADGPADVVCGFFEPVGSTFVERAIAFTVTPRLAEIRPADFLPSSRSIGFRRQAWADAGGYPEWLDYCEDLLFDLEMKRLGLRFVFVPEATVTWSARPSIRLFMKQYYRYARGDGKANLWAKRHLARYGAYIGGLVLLRLLLLSPWWLLPLGAGVFLYLRKFWGRVWGRRSEFGPGAPAALLLVPVIVVAGDLAKMAGYPAGLVWRARRKRRGD
jgi:glycosyltransferase involved in cell wall biosynthesis